MQTIKIILLLLILTLISHANIPPQTTYNENHQPLVIEYADGSTVLYEYDGTGELLSIEATDEAGQSTQYGYDTSRTMPLLNQVTLANSAVTHYSYDSEGKKTSQTDALNHSTSWTYKSTG